MPFDSEGNFTRIHSWEDDRINGIEIVTERHDEEDDNFAAGFNETFLRDGRVAMTGVIDMGGYKIQNCGKGVIGTDLITKDQLTDNVITTTNNLMLVGDIKASVIPYNHSCWLLCNGQAVSRTEYSELFSLIGTTFGAGDGVTTFNIPNYQGKFLRGLGGDSAGSIAETQQEGLPNIYGRAGIGIQENLAPFDISAANGSFYNAGVTGVNKAHYPDWQVQSYYLDFDASRVSHIYGASTHVTPVNQAVYYFIKAKNL